MSEQGDVALPVSCPECGKKVYERLARLEQSTMLVCSRCGSQVDASEVLKDFKRHIDDLRQPSKEN